VATSQLILVGFAVVSAILAFVLLLRRPAASHARAEPHQSNDPRATPAKAPAKEPAARARSDGDDDGDITLLTVRMDLAKLRVDGGAPRNAKDSDPPYDDVRVEPIDEDLEPAARAHRFVADRGAESDVPTLSTEAFLVSAARQTDRGNRRKNNEDRYLALDDEGVYFVADGMGGYAGGEVASQLAVDTIENVFATQRFEAKVEAELPRRATELAQAMQAANLAIWEKATDEPSLHGMGTTLVGARFALKKKRVYIGHIGDSRCYRLRHGELVQVTQDHTLAAVGVEGPMGARLVRAVGVAPEVEIDLIIAEPKIGDVYLFCSDGLNKMVPDERIRSIVLGSEYDLELASLRLIEVANERGGKDNVTVVLVGVRPPPRDAPS
jgi:protein phosphatase